MNSRALIAIAAILIAASFARANYFVFTNDTANLNPNLRTLDVHNDQALRYRGFARQGVTARDLSNSYLIWQIVDKRDEYVHMSGSASIGDATNGEFSVLEMWPRPVGINEFRVKWFDSDSDQYLGLLAWDSINIHSPTGWGGLFSFTNFNDFTAFVSNQVSLSISNQFWINLTNIISIGQTYISNSIFNTVTSFVDTTVTVPGLTVNVDNIKIPLANILTPGVPSGAVIRADGTALYADTNFQASVLVRQGTNDLGYADTLSIGPGLMAGVSNGEAVIELSGINFPGAPGTILTNVIYVHSLGTKTAQWYQVAAGVTQIFVHANSGGSSGAGGGADAGAVGRVTIPVEPFEWLSLYIGEAGFTQTNSTGAPEFTDQAWPGGGRGASRVINQKMHASAGYTAIFRGVADTNTYTNLLLILAGAAGVGQNAGDLSGGNGGGVIGENGSGSGTGYTFGRGATETSHGATYFSNFAGLAITGSMPARLRGGDAQITTNYVGPASGGSPGWYSGSASVGYAAGHGSLSASAGSGNSWFNEAVGVRGEIASGKGVNGPPWTEDYYYRTAGVQWGKPGQSGGMWIAEIVEVP